MISEGKNSRFTASRGVGYADVKYEGFYCIALSMTSPSTQTRSVGTIPLSQETTLDKENLDRCHDSSKPKEPYGCYASCMDKTRGGHRGNKLHGILVFPLGLRKVAFHPLISCY